MGKTNRNTPKNARSSDARYTIWNFDEEFPDDSTCLEWLVAHLYPEGIWCPTCDKVTKHHRVRSRTCYACQFCGHQEYPMKGTIFEGSSTSLRLWFHAMYLMASTRCGISAKQLEREVGVSYPTAWRMFKQIRSMLDQDDDAPLSGTVEIDETFIGGKSRKGDIRKDQGQTIMHQDVRAFSERKAKVMGAVERGERVSATVVPSRKASTLVPLAMSKVLPASTVYTDEFRSYRQLGKEGYEHKRVNHSQGIYVDGDVHTNTIEGFWSLVKRGLSGVYHTVSTQHLQSYLDEYAFRYNNRDVTGRRGMFDAFLSRIVKDPA
jgi:transposase-like protein